LAPAKDGGPGWADGASTPKNSRSGPQLVLDSRRSVPEIAGE
jgi:hypothetical protein